MRSALRNSKRPRFRTRREYRAECAAVHMCLSHVPAHVRRAEISECSRSASRGMFPALQEKSERPQSLRRTVVRGNDVVARRGISERRVPQYISTARLTEIFYQEH